MARTMEKRLSLLLAWGFSASAFAGIISLTILKAELSDIIFLTAFFTAVFFLTFYNKYTVSIAGLIVAAAGFYIYRHGANSPLAENFPHLIGTWRFILGFEEYSDPFNVTTLRLLAASVSCAAVIMTRLKFLYLPMFAIGGGVFIAANTAAEGIHPAFFVMLATLLVSYTIKAGGVAPAVIPLCLISVMAAFFVPMPEERLTRRTLEETYEEVYWFFREPFMPKYFSQRAMGLENALGELSGDLRLNNNFIMYVFADEPLYLLGSTKEIYTGTSWENLEQGGFEPVEKADFSLDDSIDILNMPGKEPGDFSGMEEMGIKKAYLSINIGKARTGTVFKPGKTKDITLYGDYTLAQKGMDLRCAPVFRKNAVYSADYYKIDYDNAFVANILLASKRGFYREISEILKKESPFNIYIYGQPGNTEDAIAFFEEKAHYADYVYDNYMTLPESLPQRVYDLALSITEEYETDYQKAEAIKNYLREKSYGISPGDLPEGRDFVDYFLFDSEEGYCTYYATSMAVLARAIGLPSRYNEGFILPDSKKDDLYYEVYGVNAHAWAEIYFEGVGWVPFEATAPSFFDNFYPEAASYYIYGNEDEISDFDDSIPGYNSFYYGTEDGEEDFVDEYSEAALEDSTARDKIPTSVFLIFAVASYIFFRRLQENRRHSIMRGQNHNRAAVEAFKGILDLHSFYGIPIKSHEPAITYAERAGKLSPLGTASLTEAALIFSKARFGGGEVSPEDATQLRQLYFLLYRRLSRGRHKYKFLIHRYIKSLG